MKNLTLIIPMHGLGSKFSAEHYIMPKPLINVLGKPMLFWLLDNLNMENVSTVLLPYDDVLDNFNLRYRLLSRYPNIKFLFRPIQHQTLNVLETIQIGLLELSTADLDNRTVVMDCDTFYKENILDKYNSQPHGNYTFYFKDLDDKDIFSYITIDNNTVTGIAEKVRISNNANCGVYCFENGHQLLDSCNNILKNTRCELYVSDIYNSMIKNNIAIGCGLVHDFHCVGTPEQLKIFCEKHAHLELKRFCFDLDHTLVSGPVVPGDYSTVQPITRNIEFLQHLHSQGHYIAIHTARRMKTHKGNVGAVIADIGAETIRQLEKFGITYNELHFGKPHADFYIDDLAISCNADIEKQVGFYNSVIQPRSFNHIEIKQDVVIKTGNTNGELYYYNQISSYPHLTKYFPKLISNDGNQLTLERIHGLNLSYLYTNNCLNWEQLTALLNALYELHSIPCNDITDLDVANANIKKIKNRFLSYDYSNFEDSEQLMNSMINWLDNYYSNKSFQPTIIHGDPVFTNVLIDGTNHIKLIDMRGSIDQKFTVGGDPMYDIAKIYQSLTGYDAILTGIDRLPDKKLIDLFVNKVIERYNISINDLSKMTATLYFSLIPLHHNHKCVLYYEMAKKLFNII